MNLKLIGSRFPFVPIGLRVGSQNESFEALLDTGFDGEIIVPEAFGRRVGQPNQYRIFRLADGSSAYGAAFQGTVDLVPLGTFAVEVVALGDECLIGRGLSDLFRITLDHGRQIIVEP